MKLKDIKKLLPLMVAALLGLASCSENDGEQTDEYANWQARNEQAFSDTLAYARQQASDGNTQWRVYPCWSMEDRTAYDGKTPTFNDKDDNICVRVMEQGYGPAVTPLYTDSVEVSYKGMLLPTASYASGYVFDSNFTGTYDAKRALTTQFAVSGLIDGFTTALMKMRNIGDHWMVYIPANLGYGSSTSNSSIPAYSMLRFEIVLTGYKKDSKWIRDVK